MSSIAHLLEHDRDLRHRNQPYVLATIVDTAGSTYRKAGARMIITRDGDYFGLISGGCLEGDLLLRAARVFDTGLAEIVEYDMRAEDDLVWGLGLGCNGMIRILLELVQPEQEHPVLAGLRDAFNNCSTIKIACILPDSKNNVDGPGIACACVVGNEGSTRFSERAGKLDRDVLGSALAAGMEQPKILKSSVESKECSVYIEQVNPPVHLLILGGGPDVTPLTRIAVLLGWQVTILDHRVAYASPEKFPGARRVARIDAKSALHDVKVETVSAALLMSHHFPTDCTYLNQVLKTGIPFIGLLGPRIRGMKLFEETGSDWEAEQYRVHSPIGLDIGGETPEGIALSIVAELQSVIEEREGQPLKDRKLGIHD